jgi:hypothetical protein
MQCRACCRSPDAGRHVDVAHFKSTVSVFGLPSLTFSIVTLAGGASRNFRGRICFVSGALESAPVFSKARIHTLYFPGHGPV